MTEHGSSAESLWAAEIRTHPQQAFGRLFEQHSETIYNYCFRQTASWHAAEDLTSTVFLEAWRGRERLVVQGDSLLPWLYGIATNVCRRQRRRVVRGGRAVRRRPPAISPARPTVSPVGSTTNAGWPMSCPSSTGCRPGSGTSWPWWSGRSWTTRRPPPPWTSRSAPYDPGSTGPEGGCPPPSPHHTSRSSDERSTAARAAVDPDATEGPDARTTRRGDRHHHGRSAVGGRGSPVRDTRRGGRGGRRPRDRRLRPHDR